MNMENNEGVILQLKNNNGQLIVRITETNGGYKVEETRTVARYPGDTTPIFAEFVNSRTKAYKMAWKARHFHNKELSKRRDIAEMWHRTERPDVMINASTEEWLKFIGDVENRSRVEVLYDHYYDYDKYPDPSVIPVKERKLGVFYYVMMQNLNGEWEPVGLRHVEGFSRKEDFYIKAFDWVMM